MAALKKNKKKSLYRDICEIAELYFYAVKKSRNRDLSDVDGEIDDYMKFILRVKRAFEQLTETEKEFINNDFFFEAYPNWWKKYYTKSMYYRIRRQSMLSFREAFEYET